VIELLEGDGGAVGFSTAANGEDGWVDAKELLSIWRLTQGSQHLGVKVEQFCISLELLFRS
jgi:hypothetical protein